MYLNLIQVAESFGVAEKVVEDWIRHEGLPHTPDRGRLVFDRAQVAEWAAARGLAARAGFLAPIKSSFTSGCLIGPLLRSGGIWRDVPAAGVSGIYGKVADALTGVPSPVKKLIAQRLASPQGVTVAPVGNGFALPHPGTRLALGRESGTIALILLGEPLNFPEHPVDDVPVTRLLFFIAPSPRAHLDLLAGLGRLLIKGGLRTLLDGDPDDREIFAAVDAFDKMGEENP